MWTRRLGHLASVAAISLGLAGAYEASAQEVCKRTIDLNAAISEYTEQHVMDVGDVDGHQIRIFEIHRTYPDIAPNCEDLKQTESWTIRSYFSSGIMAGPI